MGRKIAVKEPVIAARLAELMREQSIRAFATRCGVNYRRLSEWLMGRNAPDAENLRRVAVATGASVDWLLGLPDAAIMREQSRNPATLEDDVAIYVRRELALRYPPAVAEAKAGEPYEWMVRSTGLLEAAVASVDGAAKAEYAREIERLEARQTTAHLSAATDSLLRQFRSLEPSARTSVDTLIRLHQDLLKRDLDTGLIALKSSPVHLTPRHFRTDPIEASNDGHPAVRPTSHARKRASTKRRT